MSDACLMILCSINGLFCSVRQWMRWTGRSWEERKLRSSWQSPQTRSGKSAKQLGRPPGMQGEGQGHVTGQRSDLVSYEEVIICNPILISAGMMTTTTTHLHACPHQAEAGVVVAEGAMPIHQITMDMKTTMMTTMATTIMTTVVAMKTPTTATMMCTAWGAVVLVPAGGGLLHLGLVGRHRHVAVVAMPKEVRPLVVRGVAGEDGEPLSSHRGAAVLAEPEAIAEVTSAERGRQTCLTSLTPSAARPTTNRTGGPSPSPSSPCSKGPTIPVTMVTVMTPWSFHRILMGSSGSRCTKRYLAKCQQKKRKTIKRKKKKKKKKTGDWPQFFDWLFIRHPSWKKICIYLRKKWTDPRIGSRWLAGKPFGWRSERNRCGESFLTPTVTLGHVSLKKHTKYFYCYILFLILLKSTMNIYKKVDIHSQKSERTLNNDICLAGSFVHAPFLPPLLVLPLFVVYHSCLGTCL